MFGSKDVSRIVVDNAAQSSGLHVEQLKKMLPMLAMMVAGFMAKQRSGESTGNTTSDGLGGLLGGLLGGRAQQTSSSSKLGLTGLVSMFDLNGDGNPLDDIVCMMKK